MLAAQDGHDSTVELLLDRGADVEARNAVSGCCVSRDFHGWTVTVPDVDLRRAEIGWQSLLGPVGLRARSPMRHGCTAYGWLLRKRGSAAWRRSRSGAIRHCIGRRWRAVSWRGGIACGWGWSVSMARWWGRGQQPWVAARFRVDSWGRGGTVGSRGGVRHWRGQGGWLLVCVCVGHRSRRPACVCVAGRCGARA